MGRLEGRAFHKSRGPTPCLPAGATVNYRKGNRVFQQQPQPATGRAHTERQTITRDELREWINDFIQRDHNPTVADAITELQNTFLRPTLEDVPIREREDYVGMWAEHDHGNLGVIVWAGEDTICVTDTNPAWGSGSRDRKPSQVTPRPDLPRAWNADGSPVTDRGENDTPRQLETVADYAGVPIGTIVADLDDGPNHVAAYVKKYRDRWACTSLEWVWTDEEMSTSSSAVVYLPEVES